MWELKKRELKKRKKVRRRKDRKTKTWGEDLQTRVLVKAFPMLLLAASTGRAAALFCHRAAVADPSRIVAVGSGGAARYRTATATQRRRPRPLLSAAAASTSSSASSSSSSSSASSTSPLDAVSSDQALSHPTLSSLDDRSLERATKYLDLVLKANEDGLNMTAVRRRGPALLRHCADSLDLLPFIDREEKRWLDEVENEAGDGEEEAKVSEEGKEEEVGKKRFFTVVDVGSGGGFPGAALAAARPRWKLVLIDALHKRCDAVAGAAKKAGIGNAEVLWSRAEEAAAVVAPVAVSDGGGDKKKKSACSSPSLRESSPVVVARAVAEMRTLAELCLPLVELGGAWIAPKGPHGKHSQLEAELEAAQKAIEVLGGEVESVEILPPLVAGAPERSVVVVRKVKGTPGKYPRGNNLPGRRPL